jgi:hypothetical protein
MTPSFVADPVFEANPKQIGSLLQQIQDRELALPDFQRSFVWEPKRTAELLQSIMSRYPAGNLLFWRVGGGKKEFAAREVESAPPLKNSIAHTLVLDGQQRLTSLYQALTGEGEDHYFVRLNELFDPTTRNLVEVTDIRWEKAIFWLDKDGRDGKLAQNEDWQFSEHAFPVHQTDFDGWLDRYVRSTTSGAKEEDEVKKTLRRVRDAFLTPLTSYGFPVVVLPESTSLEAVCTVFETLNRTGKPLGAYELLTARMYPSGVNLRDLWADAIESYEVLTEFGIDPYNVLQAVTLRAHSSAQRSDVLTKLKAEDVSSHWNLVVQGLASVLDLLQSECGILTPKYLPYSMVLVPMSAVWEEVRSTPSAHRAMVLSRLSQFFWCTVFTSNYDQGANSQAGADYQRLKKWLFNPSETPPEAVANFDLRVSTLRNSSVRRKALYAGIMALTIKSGAKDFHTAKNLTSFQMATAKVDSHHIFPKAFLRDTLPKASAELIANRALIDAETNRIIGRRAPSEYVPDMIAAYGEDKLALVLESHLVEGGQGGALVADNYVGFIEERVGLLVTAIQEVTDKIVVDDSDL